MREADLYFKEGDHVICTACARKCKIPKNLYGFCGVRYNINGKLYVANYGLFISVALDPIEKKPLYHFYPGEYTLSLGTTGCSWACKFCINYDISHRRVLEGYEISPEELLEIAKSVDSHIVTFTYNEPSIYAEYSYDFSKIAKKEGIKITWVTNGFLSEEARKYAAKFLDAATIDIKGNANEEFLKKFSLVPSPKPIFDTIEYFYKKGIHIEITDLVVPAYGDNIKDFESLVDFILDLSDEIPLHILRFFPEYKMKDHYPTPFETLKKYYELAKEKGLKYVYLGNVDDDKYETTYCPHCGRPLIKRRGFIVYEVNLTEDNRCKFCGKKVNIVGRARPSRIAFPIPVPLNSNFVRRDVKSFIQNEQ